jgi:hypothetical protein
MDRTKIIMRVLMDLTIAHITVSDDPVAAYRFFIRNFTHTARFLPKARAALAQADDEAEQDG